jgi:hypothetical protein
LFGVLVFVATPTVVHADPILITPSGSGSLTALFQAGSASTASGTESNSALTALDLSGDPLDAVLYEVPTGTDLPPVDTAPNNDAATTNMGPVAAYNTIGIQSGAPNFELIGLLPISNVSFQSGTGPAPKLPPGIGPVSVPEPATLLLLGPAAALALRRRRRAKAAR